MRWGVSLATATATCAIALISLAIAGGPGGGGCILYGEGWAVSLGAPSGWSISCRDPNTNGVEVALWPIKSTWKDSEAVMYVNSQLPEAGESFRDFVEHAVAEFRGQQPGVVVTEGDPIATADGKPGVLRYFTGDKWGNHEAVAYVDAGEVRLIFVLSSRSQRAFDKDRQTLVAFVRSAHLMKAVIKDN